MLRRLLVRGIERRWAHSFRHIGSPIASVPADVWSRVAEQTRRGFGVVIPPVMLHGVDPRLLEAFSDWLHQTLVCGTMPRQEKEAVSVAISRINDCPYCVDAHVVSLRAAGEGHAATALDRGDIAAESLGTFSRLVEWASATRQPSAEIVRHPPFSGGAAAELAAVAVLFHYINRPVCIFLPATLFPAQAGFGVKRSIHQGLAAAIMGPAICSAPPVDPKGSTAAGELPPDLTWAADRPAIALALLGFDSALDTLSSDILSRQVREVVREQVHGWCGEDRGLSQDWLNGAIAPFPAVDRAAVRFCLLAALAAYRIDDPTVEKFRQSCRANDRELVICACWSALLAARRIGSWLGTDGLRG